MKYDRGESKSLTTNNVHRAESEEKYTQTGNIRLDTAKDTEKKRKKKGDRTKLE